MYQLVKEKKKKKLPLLENIEITGIAEVPFAGEKFMIYNNEKKAREVAETRAFNKFQLEKGIGKNVSLSEMLKNKKWCNSLWRSFSYRRTFFLGNWKLFSR